MWIIAISALNDRVELDARKAGEDALRDRLSRFAADHGYEIVSAVHFDLRPHPDPHVPRRRLFAEAEVGDDTPPGLSSPPT